MFFTCKYMLRFKSSFTLIELSIVLAVMALLTSLMLSGKHLITVSRANSVVQEISTYRQAINNFYSSSLYSNSLPGDYIEARSTFAPSDYTSSSITTSVLATAFQSGKAKQIPIDGDASGEVSAEIKGYNNETSLYYSEVFGVWSHLGHAHMIDKNYSNACYNIASKDIGDCALAGYNLPKIINGVQNGVYIFYKPQSSNNFDKGLYGIISDDYAYDSHVMLMVDITNIRIFGMSSNISNYIVGGGGGISADLMRRVDIKIDDGKPLTGRIFGLNGSEKNGKCSNYAGTTNASFSSSITRDKIIYNESENENCVGVVVFNEFG